MISPPTSIPGRAADAVCAPCVATGLRRVVIVGASGTGKSTLAADLASRLNVVHLALDDLAWEPGWQRRSRAELAGVVAAHASSTGWVVDGDYGDEVAREIWPKAASILWLDYPAALFLWRLIGRELRNGAARVEPWAGWWPHLQWLVGKAYRSWRQARSLRDTLPARVARVSPTVPLLRLASPAHARSWLSGLPGGARPGPRGWGGGATAPTATSAPPVRVGAPPPQTPPAERVATHRRAGRRVPILMYHQVMPDPPAAYRKYAVTPDRFATQMRWLALAGYTAISLDQLVAHRSGVAGLPRRPVVITFDDGYDALLDHAVPVLSSLGLTATFYLVAGLIGRSSHWLRRDRGLEFPLFDWSAARRLCAMGFTCGAHSMTHPHLAALHRPRCHNELHRSKVRLEDGLGCDVAHLAYPYGSYAGWVREIVASLGYRSACSVRIGLSTAADDLLALHRVPVTGHDSMGDFICRLHTAHPVRPSLQQMSARLLHRVRGGEP